MRYLRLFPFLGEPILDLDAHIPFRLRCPWTQCCETRQSVRDYRIGGVVWSMLDGDQAGVGRASGVTMPCVCYLISLGLYVE